MVMIPGAARASHFWSRTALAVKPRAACCARWWRRRGPRHGLLRAWCARTLRDANALIDGACVGAARARRTHLIFGRRARGAHERTRLTDRPRRTRRRVGARTEGPGRTPRAGAVRCSSAVGEDALPGRAIGVRSACCRSKTVVVPGAQRAFHFRRRPARTMGPCFAGRAHGGGPLGRRRNLDRTGGASPERQALDLIRGIRKRSSGACRTHAIGERRARRAYVRPRLTRCP